MLFELIGKFRIPRGEGFGDRGIVSGEEKGLAFGGAKFQGHSPVF